MSHSPLAQSCCPIKYEADLHQIPNSVLSVPAELCAIGWCSVRETLSLLCYLMVIGVSQQISHSLVLSGTEPCPSGEF